jgi:hypothetical protein
VRDSQSKEELPGATIQIQNLEKGTATNQDGYYSISVPEDSVTIVVTSIGYNTLTRRLLISKDTELIIELEMDEAQLEEVIIETDNYRERLGRSQMSTITITSKEAKLLPAIFGEVDLMKVLQLNPGIQSSGEGSSGIYVRGGGPDQNLFLLDQSTVYNPTHLFGFFSIFNSDAVKSIDLYKGAFPAQYGGRLSSVVDVETNNGNMQKLKGAGGIGIISSRLTLEGPIKKDKASFIISGRRTYFDIFTRVLNKAYEGKEDYSPIPDYYFYDMNGKIHWKVDSSNQLYLTGYYGNDVFGFTRGNFNFDFYWGNRNGSLRWDHTFSPKLSSQAYLILSDYTYKIVNKSSLFVFELSSKIRDYQSKIDFLYDLSPKHKVRFGGQYIHHQFRIGRIQAGSTDGSSSFSSGQDPQGNELGIYLNDNFDLGARWKFDVGMRWTAFINQAKIFNGLEPRVASRFKINEKISLKASYARMYQYVHLVANSGASLPTDMWYPSNRAVAPQVSDQVATGISFSLWDDKLFLSDEAYYKWMNRQIDFRDNAQIFGNDNLDQEFIFGRGYSYGNEVYLEKKSGKTTGWIGYTLSWTWRKFDQINQGRPFPARFDRRHDVSVVVMHKLSKRISISGTWVYGTGSATTLPIERFYLQDVAGSRLSAIPVYMERNSFRLAPYHRLDFGLVYKFTPKWGESDLTFSVYNAYNRRNPYFIYFDELVDKQTGVTTKYQAKQVSLFPFIPSVTYNFRF